MVFFITICYLNQNHHIIHRYYHCIPFEESIPHLFSSFWTTYPSLLQFCSLPNCAYFNRFGMYPQFSATQAKQHWHLRRSITLLCRQSCQPCGGEEACCSVHRPLITIWLGELQHFQIPVWNLGLSACWYSVLSSPTHLHPHPHPPSGSKTMDNNIPRCLNSVWGTSDRQSVWEMEMLYCKLPKTNQSLPNVSWKSDWCINSFSAFNLGLSQNHTR